MIASDQLNALITASSIDELWSLHTAQMTQYGFDRLLYGYSPHLSEQSFGDPADFVLLSNHDPTYLDKFIGEKMYRRAPMVRWAKENEGAQSWSFLHHKDANGGLSDEERHVLKFNRSMGIEAGYTISFKAVSSRARGAIALTARTGMSQADADAVWASDGNDILMLNNLVHLRIMTLPYKGPRDLTKRQREVLEWVGEGKTIQDIAVILDLTPATVEKHLRLARKALNAETTAQAVLKAALQNKIFQITG